MKVSTRARYALRLMIDLAAHDSGSPIKLRDVAARQQISKRYLEQLATSLRNSDLVISSPGRGGGYTLKRTAKEIGVAEIVRSSIGPINLVGCVKDPELCSRSKECASRQMWKKVNNAITDVLDSITLSELCDGSIGDKQGSEESGATPCSGPAFDT